MSNSNPIAKLLLEGKTTWSKKKFAQECQRYVDDGSIHYWENLAVYIYLNSIKESDSCPICSKNYAQIIKRSKSRNGRVPRVHTHYLHRPPDWENSTFEAIMKWRDGISNELNIPLCTKSRHSLHITKGQNFLKSAANLLKDNKLSKVGDIYLSEEEIKAIKEFFPEFSIDISSSAIACPMGLDKEVCGEEWKATQSNIYFAQRDIPGAKLLLSGVHPEIAIRPKIDGSVIISKEDFWSVVNTAYEIYGDSSANLNYHRAGSDEHIHVQGDSILIDATEGKDVFLTLKKMHEIYLKFIESSNVT